MNKSIPRKAKQQTIRPSSFQLWLYIALTWRALKTTDALAPQLSDSGMGLVGMEFGQWIYRWFPMAKRDNQWP